MASGGPHALRLGIADEIPWLKRQTRSPSALGLMIRVGEITAAMAATTAWNGRSLTSDDILATSRPGCAAGRAGFPTGIKWRPCAASADRIHRLQRDER